MQQKKSMLFLLSLIVFVSLSLVSCGSGGGGAMSVANPLTVFVTSVKGSGNLSVWSDAGGATGLAAGDAICQARANAAGLTGTYKAWLSTSTTDAYCHIQGYDNHTISDNCGRSALPTNAGPWVRTDGYPFARTIAKLTNDGQVFTPVRYNENGILLYDQLYFTGTKADGTAAPNNCSDWTNSTNSASARFGYTEGTTGMWTDEGGILCDGSIRLICFQTGTGGSLPSMTSPSGSKKVFVTSTTYDGNLGGLSGADAMCRAAAQAAGLANYSNYKAWLSDTTNNAGTRITSDGPWYRLDGVKVASNKAALTGTSSASLFTAISQTETGSYVGQYQLVWTGTGDNGVALGDRCVDWNNSTDSHLGQVGYATLSNSSWTTATTFACTNMRALYCFED